MKEYAMKLFFKMVSLLLIIISLIFPRDLFSMEGDLLYMEKELYITRLKRTASCPDLRSGSLTQKSVIRNPDCEFGKTNAIINVFRKDQENIIVFEEKTRSLLMGLIAEVSILTKQVNESRLYTLRLEESVAELQFKFRESDIANKDLTKQVSELQGYTVQLQECTAELQCKFRESNTKQPTKQPAKKNHGKRKKQKKKLPKHDRIVRILTAEIDQTASRKSLDQSLVNSLICPDADTITKNPHADEGCPITPRRKGD